MTKYNSVQNISVYCHITKKSLVLVKDTVLTINIHQNGVAKAFSVNKLEVSPVNVANVLKIKQNNASCK